MHFHFALDSGSYVAAPSGVVSEGTCPFYAILPSCSGNEAHPFLRFLLREGCGISFYKSPKVPGTVPRLVRTPPASSSSGRLLKAFTKGNSTQPMLGEARVLEGGGKCTHMSDYRLIRPEPRVPGLY